MFLLLLLFASLFSCSQARGRLRSQKVSSSVKDDILAAADPDDAFALYLSSYEELAGPAMLMAAVDPATQQRAQLKKKTNFVKSLSAAKEHNHRFDIGETKYRMTLNSFSVMDEDERKRHLGAVNVTRSVQENQVVLRGGAGGAEVPRSLNWDNKGYISTSFDQGECGSCWTYPSTALLEFALMSVTGKLVQLSNQQLLDCVYEYVIKYGDNNDGCNGGWYHDAWDYIIETQHIAPLAKYSYRGADYRCDYTRYPNALEGNIKVTGYRDVRPTERAIIDALQIMPLAVAMFVEEDFYGYDRGLYDGCLVSYDSPDHAVLLTGYTHDYWEIRNSWGPDWGINGFGRFERKSGRSPCLILDFAAYITFENLREDAPDEEPVETEPPTVQSSSSTSPTGVTEQQITTPIENPTTYEQYECYPGQFDDGKGCEVCPEDSYSGYGARSCSACPEGTNSLEGSQSAEDCTEPSYQCFNMYQECETWAEYGYCQNGEYLALMENNCRLACSFCSDHCEAGFYRVGGECVACPEDTYSAYQSRQCTPCPAGTQAPAGSTDVSACATTAGDCRDEAGDTWCNVYVPHGYCQTKPTLMARKCSRSCGICADDLGEDCTDIYEAGQCVLWRAGGYCYDPEYSALMAKFCGRTCGTCREEQIIECHDTDQYAVDCPAWASLDYCQGGTEYSTFMVQHCAMSCGTCEGASRDVTADQVYETVQPTTDTYTEEASETVLSTTESSTTTPATSCWEEDTGLIDRAVLGQHPFTSFPDCESMCAVTSGCEGVMVSPASWRTRRCIILGQSVVERRRGWLTALRSCFEPHGRDEEAECEDAASYEVDCTSWAALGYCSGDQYSSFMQDNCRGSCGACVCKNTANYETDCPTWAQLGHCTAASYSEWMRDNCADSCGLCEGDREECQDVGDHAAQCPYWAQENYCTRGAHVQFMKMNCPASCGKCSGGTGSSTTGRGRA